MGRRPERAHPCGAGRPPRTEVVSRAPDRADAAAGHHRGAGPRDRPRSAWSGPPVPSSSCSPAVRPPMPTLRRSCCSTRRAARRTRPRPSTGSRRHRTARSSPSGRAKAGPRSRCCWCSTRPTAGTAVSGSRTRGRAAWRGIPTAAASPTPATRRASTTTAACTTTRAATGGRTIRSCGTRVPTRKHGPTSRSRPTGHGSSSTCSSDGPASTSTCSSGPRGGGRSPSRAWT